MAFKTPLSITSSTSKACATGRKGKLAARDIGKKKIKGQGLFSKPRSYRSRCHEAGESPKNEESDFSRDDSSKVKPLSPSSLLPRGHSSHTALPASVPNMRDPTRYNLRSLFSTNKLSLMNSSPSIPFGQNGLKGPMCGASSDSLDPTTKICIRPKSEVDDRSLKSTGEAESRKSSAEYKFSSLGTVMRDNSNHVNDTKDRGKVCDVEACLKNETEQENSQICQNKDDQGLSTGMKELVLGKRGRESEYHDSGVAGTKAKKVALSRTRLHTVPKILLVEKA